MTALHAPPPHVNAPRDASGPSPAPGGPYVPPGFDGASWPAVEALVNELRARPVESPAAADAWLNDRSELEAACSEARARLYINMTCDTEDEAVAAAYAGYIERVAPELQRAGFELDRRQVALCERFGLVADRHAVLHRDTRAEVDLFRPENVALHTELAQLGQRYQRITGSMTVQFDGQTRTMPQMAAYQERTDRAVREAAWRAVTDRRLADADEIDGMYDAMVQRRDRLARNAGFPDYLRHTFVSKHRFDYSPADCRAFHAAVEHEIMPFCAELDARRRRDLGLAELKPWDLGVDPKGRGPLRPFTDGADLVARTRRVMHALDGELAGMFESMGDGRNTRGIATGELLDLDSRKGKAPGGYQYMQDFSRKPFIFMNAAGLHRDVETMVHEAGHAFHSMLCKDDPWLHYRHSPIEFAEVASMSMELLTMRHWGVPGGFYENPSDLARAQRKQLEGSLALLPWIATIDAFQHWVYERPRHDRAERKGAWKDLVERFGLRGNRVAWGPTTAAARDFAWQAQPHLFGHPLYYIEYGIAQLGALQLWARSLDEGEAVAVDAYKRALRLGGSRPLPDLFAAAGLRLDFSRGMFARLRDRVQRELERLPE